MKALRKAALIAGILAIATAPVAGSAQDLSELFGGPPLPKGEELEKLIEKAKEHPLGSEENPVRADMPKGQRAYLNRLRCGDGNAPSYRRVGNLGPGVYGRIVDSYRVVCEGSAPAESFIVMDMYHPDYEEALPVPGFTIRPLPACGESCT